MKCWRAIICSVTVMTAARSRDRSSGGNVSGSERSARPQRNAGCDDHERRHQSHDGRAMARAARGDEGDSGALRTRPRAAAARQCERRRTSVPHPADGTVKYRLVHLKFGPEEKLGFDIAIFTPAKGGPFPTIINPSFFNTPGVAVTNPSAAQSAVTATNAATTNVRPAPGLISMRRSLRNGQRRGFRTSSAAVMPS